MLEEAEAMMGMGGLRTCVAMVLVVRRCRDLVCMDVLIDYQCS